MATDDVFMLTIKALWNGQQVVNSLAFRALDNTAYNAATFSTIAAALKEVFRTNQVDDLVWSDWRALQVRGAGTTYQTTAPFRVATVAYAGAMTGTLPGSSTLSPLPNNVAAVVRVNTDQAGRRRKGRMYVGGLAESWVDDTSLLATAYTSALQTSLSGFHSVYGPGGTSTRWIYGVWSDRIAMNVALSNTWPRVRTSQGAPSPSTAFADGVSFDVQPYVGSQRGRRPGV